MYYEINVSLNTQHFFATSERSISNMKDLKKIYNILKEKFPEEEGYKIIVTKWDKIGHSVDLDSIDYCSSF
jgi:hypothetical protein